MAFNSFNNKRVIQKQRVMFFIDGSNFLNQLSHTLGIEFSAHKPPASAVYCANNIIKSAFNYGEFNIIRRYWFGSVQGTEKDVTQIKEILSNQHFDPIILKKNKGKSEKGVDISLTIEMLVNAFNQNYDIGILIAGDEDYLGLVQEVKRYGQQVFTGFFEKGFSKKLRLSSDVSRFFNNIEALEPCKNRIFLSTQEKNR